jgi:flagellar basal-body rod modification protein FlgD
VEVNSTQTQVRGAGEALLNARNRTTGGDRLEKDDFLKLLMTQMTNQDPLNPLDSKGMMDQFAQMGSLEQLQNINVGLDRLNKSQAEVLQSTAAAYLEKDVTVKGGTARVEGGATTPVEYKIPRDASVQVTIIDPGGSPVRTIDLGAQGPGSHQMAWDGKDADGDVVPNGRYAVQFTARSSDESEVPVDMFVTGRVSGVRFEDGKQFIKLHGDEYTTGDVVSVSNESERLFGKLAPMALRERLTPMPPVVEKQK